MMYFCSHLLKLPQDCRRRTECSVTLFRVANDTEHRLICLRSNSSEYLTLFPTYEKQLSRGTMSCDTYFFFFFSCHTEVRRLPANMSSDTSGFTCKHVKRGSGLWAWFIFSWMLPSLMSIRWLKGFNLKQVGENREK